MWWVFLVEFSIWWIGAFALYWNLSHSPRGYVVPFFVMLGWCVAGMCLFLTIHDIQNSNGLRHDPWISIPLNEIELAWKIVYWSSFALSFIVFPFLAAYVNAPDFGVLARIWRAFVTNLLLYSSLVVTIVAGGTALYFTDSFSISGMVGILMCVSNIYTMTLLMFFLGFGLFQVVSLTNKRSRLSYTTNEYKNSCFEYTQKAEKEKYKMRGLMKILKSIKLAEVPKSLRGLLGSVIKKLMNSKWGSEFGDVQSGALNSTGKITKKKLVELNRKAKKRLYKRERAEALAHYNIQQYRYFHSVIHPGEQEKGCGNFYKTSIEPIFWFLLSLVFFICAVFVVFVENSAFLLRQEEVDPNFALGYYFFRELDFSYSVTFTLALVLILFMGVSAFVGVLRLRLFALYRVLWHHTDRQSLLFSSSWAVQLAPMLAYNFMTITTLQGVALNKVFIIMDAIPVVGINFPYYIPCLCGFFFIASVFYGCCCERSTPVEENLPLVQRRSNNEPAAQNYPAQPQGMPAAQGYPPQHAPQNYPQPYSQQPHYSSPYPYFGGSQPQSQSQPQIQPQQPQLQQLQPQPQPYPQPYAQQPYQPAYQPYQGSNENQGTVRVDGPNGPQPNDPYAVQPQPSAPTLPDF